MGLWHHRWSKVYTFKIEFYTDLVKWRLFFFFSMHIKCLLIIFNSKMFGYFCLIFLFLNKLLWKNEHSFCLCKLFHFNKNLTTGFMIILCFLSFSLAIISAHQRSTRHKSSTGGINEKGSLLEDFDSIRVSHPLLVRFLLWKTMKMNYPVFLFIRSSIKLKKEWVGETFI